MDKILVFVPMYNCENQIVRVLKQITPEVQKRIHTVLVVDNGSKDNGREAAREGLKVITGCETRLIRNRQNVSLGGSHKVAFNYTLSNNFDYCIVLHGDDQADIADLIPYLDSGQYRSYDCFLGARFHHKSKLLGYSRFKTLGNHVLNFLISLVMLKWVKDMGSGINMYKSSYLKSKHYLKYPNDLTFNVFMLFHAYYLGATLHYFPITWREFDQVSNAKAFKQAKRILRLVVSYMAQKKWLFSDRETPEAQMKYDFDELFFQPVS